MIYSIDYPQTEAGGKADISGVETVPVLRIHLLTSALGEVLCTVRKLGGDRVISRVCDTDLTADR